MLNLFFSLIVILKSKKHNDLPPIFTVNFKVSSKEYKNSSSKSMLSTSPVRIVIQSSLCRPK